MERNWSNLDKMYPKVRKWQEKDIIIKLTNLARKFGWLTIQEEMRIYSNFTDNKCDMMNLAYYSLKDKYCRINRHIFGVVRTPEYEPKWYNYSNYSNTYTNAYKVVANSYYNTL